ncbi:MAG: hypothetical protein ABIX37_03345 [Gammaproteobacteria bacterium]
MASNVEIRTVPAVDVPDHYVDAGAIVAGALVATAVSVVLVTFGSGLGLSFTSAEPGDGMPLRWIAIAAGAWVIWTAVTSGAAGGYFAGRMRKRVNDSNADEMETRDGAHGIAVWALATLIAAILAASGIAGTVRAIGSALPGPAGALAAVISKNTDYLTGVALRNESRVPSVTARREIAAVLIRGFDNGDVSDGDRGYLASVLARESQLDRAEARTRVDQLVADAMEARDKAIKAAEQGRIFALIGAFTLAASLLVSAAAAYLSAVLGGKHRNENVGFGRFGSAPRPRT